MKLIDRIINLLAPLGIPLAWRQLTFDPKRFFTAIAGVTFGLVLMIYQLGIYTAAKRMAVLPHDALKGELIILSRNYNYFDSNKPFPKTILFQVPAFPEVESVAPLSVVFGMWKNITTGVDRYISILAVNPSQNPFTHPELTNQIHLLKVGENVLYDRKSNTFDFGKVVSAFQEKGETTSEVENVRIKVKGLFSMGQTLVATGHIVMSDEGLAILFPKRPANLINIGLVSLKPGTDIEAMRQRLSSFLSKDVQVKTAEQFRIEEQDFWISRTMIGFITLAGMLVGMFVGGIVFYQILYTDVTTHLREYATLKAIGLTDQFLFRVIMTEALILLVVSFLPTMIITGGLFFIARNVSGIPTGFAVSELLVVITMAAAASSFAGLLASRKLKAADPADIY